MNCPTCGKFMEQNIDWFHSCLVFDCWECDERIVDYGEKLNEVLLKIRNMEIVKKEKK